jgi:hypothetical protein
MTFFQNRLIPQVNWTDTNTWGMWSQANAEILADGVVDFEIYDHAMAPTTGQASCRWSCVDRNEYIVPFKTTSPLFPNIKKDRRARVLLEDPDAPGTYKCVYFGLLATVEPSSEKERPAMVSVTLDSPIKKLMEKTVEVEQQPIGTRASACMSILLTQMELINTPFAEVSPFVREVALPTPWGGGKLQVGRAWSELLALSGSILTVEPQLATAQGEPDWILKVKQPTASAPVATWTAAAGKIHPGSGVTFGSKF